MRCELCEKSSEQVEIGEGIFGGRLIRVCSSCASMEDILMIKKPTAYQIEKSKETNYSVRDRMERISGMKRIQPVLNEHTIVKERLSHLRDQPRKQEHPDVLPNYYWKVNMGRRRKKLSPGQLGLALGIPKETIEGIEKGIIPKNFREVFQKLEDFIGERLLREQVVSPVQFKRSPEYEKNILDSVRGKMGKKPDSFFEDAVEDDDTDLLSPEEKMIFEERKKIREERSEKITKGEFDFSDKKAIDRLTLNDLADIKRKKELKVRQLEEKKKKDDMIGEDIDLDDL